SCPYRIDATLRAQGLRSGFDDCWTSLTGLPEAELQEELVVDMGRLDVSSLVAAGHYKLSQVDERWIKRKSDGKPGLSDSERKWLRIEKLAAGDKTSYFDRDAYAEEAAGWTYPLHMIDFETMAAAVPFHSGHRPYEQIAFQFSHHQIEADGRINHRTQYLACRPGDNPNLDFLRALRRALSQDEGTIFRYAAHENTILCTLIRQIDDMQNRPPDAAELCDWVRGITHAPLDAAQSWEGKRDMVDMLRLVKRYDYHPATRGSNSIKYVLPAVLADSAYLQRKYSRPIYGGAHDLQSHNFAAWRWIDYDARGELKNPYKLLPPLYDASDSRVVDYLFGDDEIREGGAASTAYARLQFTQMSPPERAAIEAGLLKY
ncbi:MAG: DUF2779 domain-containing protein, partial [Deltaproteobacteria bacterium]